MKSLDRKICDRIVVLTPELQSPTHRIATTNTGVNDLFFVQYWNMGFPDKAFAEFSVIACKLNKPVSLHVETQSVRRMYPAAKAYSRGNFFLLILLS